jgi:type IX secretion system PorP/SprF family membrane protein
MRAYTCIKIAVLAISSFGLNAQDQSNFTQFYLNPYLLNASYAGIDGQPAVGVMYKRQWTNIQGGPSIANVNLQAPLNAKIGVGASISNDKRGLLTNSGLQVSMAYNLPVADFSNIRFGLSVGGSWNTIDPEAFDTSTDPALVNMLNKNASITGNAGVSFHHKMFNLGISMPTLFSPSFVSEDAFTITEVKPFQSLVFHTSHRFYFNNNTNIFEPYLVYRLNSGLPSQVEVAGVMHFNHILWAGGSFKQDFGISALAGIKLKNMLAMGASYSLGNSGINELNSPSFEISLNYLLGERKKGLKSYSFVNTTKPKEKKQNIHTPAKNALAKQKQEEAKAKQAEALAKRQEEAKLRQQEIKRKQEEALAQRTEETKLKQEQLLAQKKEEARIRQEAYAKAQAEKKKAEEAALAKNNPTQTKAPGDSVAPNPNHTSRFQQQMEQKPVETVAVTDPVHEEGHPAHEEEKLQRLEVHADNPTEHHEQEVDAHPHAERHEFVKRGGHKDELDVADYVIAGVFKSDVNAKHFSDGLNKLGLVTDYGHLTERNLWYVFTIQTEDLNEARAERDRVRKMKLLRDAWLLTVHH